MRVCFWPNMATTAMVGQKQTLMLQLFTGNYNVSPSTFRRAENPTYMKRLIYTSPDDSEENR